MPKIVKRNTALSSRMLELVGRRNQVRTGETPKAPPGLMDGGVVELEAEHEPLSDMLAKSRYQSRPPRQVEYLHVSDLLSKCMRRIALMHRLDLPPRPQSLSLTDSLTFAQGDAIHETLRLRASSGDPGRAWGNWSCKCGVTKTDSPCLLSQVVSKAPCPHCKTPIVQYVEVPMRDEEYKITGSPDFLLYLPELSAIHVTELKSISHDAWKELVRPIPDHILQVLFYWKLMERKGYRLTNKVSILYATKGWMFSGNPFKEFVVDVQSQIKRLDPMIDDAQAVKASRTGGELPVRICASATSTEAKKCDVCTQCFGLNNNATPIKISISTALAGTRKKK